MTNLIRRILVPTLVLLIVGGLWSFAYLKSEIDSMSKVMHADPLLVQRLLEPAILQSASADVSSDVTSSIIPSAPRGPFNF